MKAATYTRYGTPEVLEIKDIPRPDVSETEILVRVAAASVTTADWRLRASAFPAFAWLPGRLMFGLFAPRNQVLGSDFSGEVVAVGKAVTRFKPGDAVFGASGKGAHAEFVAVGQDSAVCHLPETLDLAGAAAVPFGALSALVFLRDVAQVQAGQSVLITGATGGVGVYAVQLAKQFGAKVTAVCSARNLGLAAELGADQTIDYLSEDFAQRPQRHDVILDTVGATNFDRCRQALTPHGVYVPIEFGFREVLQSLVPAWSRAQRVAVDVSGDRREDLVFLTELLSSGAIRTVIDGHYPLSHIADAHRRVETRHKTGSVIVDMPSAQDCEPGRQGARHD